MEIVDAMDILNDLDLLNEKTCEYYKTVFWCIEDAITTGDDFRAKRRVKEFNTLIEPNDIDERLNKKTNVS
jgi:hypothetical protein